MSIRNALQRTTAERHKVVSSLTNGVIGLAAGAFAASALFATFEVAPYWAGVWTGIICTGSTLFGAGFSLVYRPTL